MKPLRRFMLEHDLEIKIWDTQLWQGPEHRAYGPIRACFQEGETQKIGFFKKTGIKAQTQFLGNTLAQWPLGSAAEGGRLCYALLRSRQKCPAARPNQKQKNQKCPNPNFRVSEYGRQLFRGSNLVLDGLENQERSKNRKFRLQEKFKETMADQSTPANFLEELKKDSAKKTAPPRDCGRNSDAITMARQRAVATGVKEQPSDALWPGLNKKISSMILGIPRYYPEPKTLATDLLGPVLDTKKQKFSCFQKNALKK